LYTEPFSLVLLFLLDIIYYYLHTYPAYFKQSRLLELTLYDRLILLGITFSNSLIFGYSFNIYGPHMSNISFIHNVHEIFYALTVGPFIRVLICFFIYLFKIFMSSYFKWFIYLNMHYILESFSFSQIVYYVLELVCMLPMVLFSLYHLYLRSLGSVCERFKNYLQIFLYYYFVYSSYYDLCLLFTYYLFICESANTLIYFNNSPGFPFKPIHPFSPCTPQCVCHEYFSQFDITNYVILTLWS
jgi:hypothetical protein